MQNSLRFELRQLNAENWTYRLVSASPVAWVNVFFGWTHGSRTG